MNVIRWKSLFIFVVVLMLALPLVAQDTKYGPQGEQIPGPASDSVDTGDCCWTADQPAITKKLTEAWLKDIQHYRRERLIRMGYDGGKQYERPALAWTQSAWIQPQMMMQDRFFYDPKTGKYTVGRYLDDLDKRYGGIDAVLIWHTYPNIGIDNRNQDDWLRDMPGGIAGVRKMVGEFHRRGVRVLFPIMLWDQGTRDEGVPNWKVTAKLLAEVDADGINGDTLPEVPLAYRTASDAIGHPLAFEPEGAPGYPGEALMWNNMTWGYFKYPFVPMVDLYKWLEPRHMTNVNDRWARSKVDNLQAAFFNGDGYESWENVWGIWNQIDDRDAEALRRIATIERANSALLHSAAWTPHVPVLRYGIFASRFPGNGETLWTVVNRNEFTVDGGVIEIQAKPGRRYFDLWHGTELHPGINEGEAQIRLNLEAQGYGAILALDAGHSDAGLDKLLAAMKKLSARPLRSYSNVWHFLPQQIVPIPPTRPATSTPAGMVKIPGGRFLFQVHGIEIEGGNRIGVDVQESWEDSPRRYHRHWMTIPSFSIDRYPVTNREYKAYLDRTQYRPNDAHHFLKEWNNGEYPQGWADKPVTWVSLEDARAYCAAEGKRLPHEWEWQYAAQGTDGRLYPWGNQWDDAAVPKQDQGRTLPPPSDVNAHPKGASPFGVMDMVGNVWQYTDEFRDPHTAAVILRGGSHYHPQGSRWYFPEAYRLDEHGKFLLMAPSTDRSGTLGFRCVQDAR